MKVAVITPYYNETDITLSRCMNSVAEQTYMFHELPSTYLPYHIIVADTNKRLKRKSLYFNNGQLINLGCNHNDAGATPRAIGAISAFSQGYDAVAFLDADNSYERTHIDMMVKTCIERGSDLVTATRNIYSKFDDTFMYTDTIESNGIDFCDTNCLFITKRLMPLMTYWIMSRDLTLAGDRVFWNQIVNNKSIKRFHCDTPTVKYYTKWSWHFQQANMGIPDDSIWMNQDLNGKVTIHKHKERT